MNDETILLIVTISILGVIEIVALYMGINGQIFASIIMIISNIVTAVLAYRYGQSRPKESIE